MKWKDLDINDFQDLHHSGMAVAQLAEHFGVSIDTIYTWLKKLGLAPNNPHRKDIDLAALLDFHTAGMTVGAIAQKFGVTHKVIAVRLHGLGLVPHSRRKDIDLVALREMYDDEVPVKEAARRMGVASSVILSRLGDLGLTPRTGSEAMYIRMRNTPPEERRRLADAAHSAVRGVRQTEEHRRKIAITREAIQFKVSRTETIFSEMLGERGIHTTPQKAIGRYNVDLALDEFPIVVEINGGGWHGTGAHAARYAKRTKYLLDCGLDVVVIWITTTNSPLECGAADYVVSLTKKLGSQKPIRGQEHMIKGDGKSTSIGQRKFNNLPAIPCSERRNKVTGRFKPRPFDETIEM